MSDQGIWFLTRNAAPNSRRYLLNLNLLTMITGTLASGNQQLAMIYGKSVIVDLNGNLIPSPPPLLYDQATAPTPTLFPSLIGLMVNAFRGKDLDSLLADVPITPYRTKPSIVHTPAGLQLTPLIGGGALGPAGAGYLNLDRIVLLDAIEDGGVPINEFGCNIHWCDGTLTALQGPSSVKPAAGVAGSCPLDTMIYTIMQSGGVFLGSYEVTPPTNAWIA
jgi:hypothetical protein